MDPRSLYGQVKQTLVKAYAKDKILWKTIIKHLPPVLQKEVKYLFLITDLSFVTTPHISILNHEDLCFHLLKNAVCDFRTCTEPMLLKQLFIDMLPVTSYHAILRKTKYLLHVEGKFLIYILPKIDNIIIINNLLIIASYYGDLDVVKLCVKEGGDDFLSAKKAAGLTRQHHIMSHLNSSKPLIPNKFVNTKSYRIYHRAIDNYNDCCDDVQLQHLTMLRGYFTIRRPLSYVPCQIEDLGIPMSCWGELNIFRLMCSLHINKTSYLGCYSEHMHKQKNLQN